jgi:hypothetical protein
MLFVKMPQSKIEGHIKAIEESCDELCSQKDSNKWDPLTCDCVISTLKHLGFKTEAQYVQTRIPQALERGGVRPALFAAMLHADVSDTIVQDNRERLTADQLDRIKVAGQKVMGIKPRAGSRKKKAHGIGKRPKSEKTSQSSFGGMAKLTIVLAWIAAVVCFDIYLWQNAPKPQIPADGDRISRVTPGIINGSEVQKFAEKDVQPSPKTIRTWTSADGSSTIEAELLRVESGMATFKRLVDGRKVTVNADVLSTEDRAFINEYLSRQ